MKVNPALVVPCIVLSEYGHAVALPGEHHEMELLRRPVVPLQADHLIVDPDPIMPGRPHRQAYPGTVAVHRVREIDGLARGGETELDDLRPAAGLHRRTAGVDLAAQAETPVGKRVDDRVAV